MSDVNTYDMALDLAESLTISNVKWTDWERRFIEGFARQVLEGEAVKFSARQEVKILELWDKL